MNLKTMKKIKKLKKKPRKKAKIKKYKIQNNTSLHDLISNNSNPQNSSIRNNNHYLKIPSTTFKYADNVFEIHN